MLHALQMLCPGCATHGMPQSQRAYDLFRDRDLATIGLHTVFDHHAAMTPVSLAAFVHEYQESFPIGVDLPGEDSPIPVTMRRYKKRDTPTRSSSDATDASADHGFGRENDMTLSAILGSLVDETAPPS